MKIVFRVRIYLDRSKKQMHDNYRDKEVTLRDTLHRTVFRPFLMVPGKLPCSRLHSPQGENLAAAPMNAFGVLFPYSSPPNKKDTDKVSFLFGGEEGI